MTTTTTAPYHFRDVQAIAAAIEALEDIRQRRAAAAHHVPRPDGTFDTVPADAAGIQVPPCSP